MRESPNIPAILARLGPKATSRHVRSLAARITVNHALAEQLWPSNAVPAKRLAILIADPSAFTPGDLDRWAHDLPSVALHDAFVALACASCHAPAAAGTWRASHRAPVARLGWLLTALLATEGRLDAEQALSLLRGLPAAWGSLPPTVRPAVVKAIVAIGRCVHGALAQAQDVAARLPAPIRRQTESHLHP